MSKYFKVPISQSSKNGKICSWEDKIKENYGPLSGYASDLEKKTINNILLDILSFNEEGQNNYPNYLNIKDVYIQHIKSLQDVEKENQTLKQEIETLRKPNPSIQTVNILLKYGILSGIEFFIPYEKNYKQYKDIMGDNVFIGTKPESLYQKYYDDLKCNIDYIPDKQASFRFSDLRLNLKVLVFSKAKSKLYDITNFISEVSTFVAKESGGNFTLKMHLFSEKELENKEHFQNNDINFLGDKKALILQSLFRENDLVFIKYEKLKIEKENDIKNSEGFFADFKERFKKIKGKYWDMIGLIDTSQIISDYNSMYLSISGRDLIKLLIEDSNIFIPYQWANNPETIFGGDEKTFKRLFSTGEYASEFVSSFKSVENSIGFILSQLTNIEILNEEGIRFLKEEYEDELSEQFTKEENKKINGIWGIVKYVVDEKITHYRLADASLKSPSGSVLQQILKICQQPFIEVIADTFVDKYNIIIRKPPFTMEDIAKSTFLIVGKSNVIKDNLQFSREIYSVYQLIPQGGCYVDNESIALSYLPMIVLDEYAKLWGVKVYSQVYNYMTIDAYNKIDRREEKTIKEHFIEELIWLIKSTIYLPFSRTGQITIKGDRRIKVGQWIYYEKTNEVFYVDSVSNSASIVGGKVNRVTTLNVSRGLVKNFIKPYKRSDVVLQFENESGGYDEFKSRNVRNISYEDIIDIDLLKEGLKELCIKINGKFNTKLSSDGENFKYSLIIKEVFEFFLNGNQFKENVHPFIYNTYKEAVTLDDLNNKDNFLKVIK